MKRFLALILVAFTFAFTAVAPVSHATAAPVGDPNFGKPQDAVDAQLKDSKDTAATDADKKATKPAKKHKKSKKKAAKKADDAKADATTTTTTTTTKDAAKKDAK